jgi:2-polyprenyl-6-methoxyphenol hydroxylase-like FAD-dependent oxidoreductase
VPVPHPVKVLIAGGGIGGLTTALALHARGIACEIREGSAEIRELGVGINTLPHAIRELRDLGLLDELDRHAIRTAELLYLTRRGQEVWREPRGLDAGQDVPQLSIHRGVLQAVILRAVRDRLGPGAVRTASRLVSFEQDADGVDATFDGPGGPERVRADALVGADGIHSTVREALHPGEGPPRWNGTMLFRGATEWPAFLTGRSMIIAGGMEAKVVLYPIGPGAGPDTRLTNWAVQLKQGEAGPPPVPQSWSRAGRLADLEPHLERFAVDAVDVVALARATEQIYEFPMCDRDPLPRWSHGRVTLLGDAAHPMYPVGSNGASQAVLDARVLADELAAQDDVPAALAAYEAARRPATAEIVHANRKGGPEGVIDAVERLAPQGFEDVEAVLPHAERAAIVQGYAAKSVSGGATGLARSAA